MLTSALVQCCVTGKLLSLGDDYKTGPVEDYIERMKAAAPRIYWEVQCYHMELHDIDDGPRPVYTHKEIADVIFNLCEDVSETPRELHKEIVKLKVLKVRNSLNCVFKYS